jgi:hypothetical protein
MSSDQKDQAKEKIAEKDYGPCKFGGSHDVYLAASHFGMLLAVLLFPIGIWACLKMRKLTCSKCEKTFDDDMEPH